MHLLHHFISVTYSNKILGAIHSTKIPTGPTGKRGPPQKVDPFFRNFSGWTEPIHWVLDQNFRKFWLNGSRPFSPSLPTSFIFFPLMCPGLNSNDDECYLSSCLFSTLLREIFLRHSRISFCICKKPRVVLICWEFNLITFYLFFFLFKDSL